MRQFKQRIHFFIEQFFQLSSMVIIQPNISLRFDHEDINSLQYLLYNFVLILVNISILLNLFHFECSLLFFLDLLFFGFGSVFDKHQFFPLSWILQDVSKHVEINSKQRYSAFWVLTTNNPNLIQKSAGVELLLGF